MPAMDASQELPIDISYAKLADWLVDRRRIPGDWRKKLAQIRNKITSALLSLPKHVDPWLLSLSPESVGYLEARKIRDILIRNAPEERTMFGRLAGAPGEWDAIVRAYEKDYIYLGEAAQIMVQNVNYDIPFQKKQIAKFQQQLADLERKEAEFKRNAAASASRYQQACQELGILGKDIHSELLASVNSLPGIFSELGDILCRPKIDEALQLYQVFVSYAHTEPEDGNIDTLETLRDARDKKAEIFDGEGDFSSLIPREKDHYAEYSQEVQWDITGTQGDEEEDAQGIQWDIDLGAETANSNLETPDEESEINWDIDIEEGNELEEKQQEEDIHNVSSSVEDTNVGTVPQSRLIDMSYRNGLLNDLFEVRAFLVQRVQELESTVTSTLQSQMQAVAPNILQQYSAQALKDMISEVSAALNLLTSSKTRDLLMILSSRRFLERLEASLQQKKQTEIKCLESLKDLESKRMELRNGLSSSWPKQEERISRTKQVKASVEQHLSRIYDGRTVNIIGEINTIIN